MHCTNCGFGNPSGSGLCLLCAQPCDASYPNPEPQALPSGSPLQSEAYHVGRMIGRGAYGVVYLGSETYSRRLVAIKECFLDGCVRIGSGRQALRHPDPALWRDATRRLEEEARYLGRFRHPNLLACYACFTANDTVYMVTEYLAGRTLEQLLGERAEGRLPMSEALPLVRTLAVALTALHHEGVLHLDVTPSNVMLCDDGRVVLFDFGAAEEFALPSSSGAPVVFSASFSSQSPVSQGGYHTRSLPLDAVHCGTEGYASLEQSRLRTVLDERADVHQLAALLYRLLTGRVPVPAKERHMTGGVLPSIQTLRPEVNRELSDVVQQALDLLPDKRPATMEKLLHALERAAPAPALPMGRSVRVAPSSIAPSSMASTPPPVAPGTPQNLLPSPAPGLRSLVPKKGSGPWPHAAVQSWLLEVGAHFESSSVRASDWLSSGQARWAIALFLGAVVGRALLLALGTFPSSGSATLRPDPPSAAVLPPVASSTPRATRRKMMIKSQSQKRIERALANALYLAEASNLAEASKRRALKRSERKSGRLSTVPATEEIQRRQRKRLKRPLEHDGETAFSQGPSRSEPQVRHQRQATTVKPPVAEQAEAGLPTASDAEGAGQAEAGLPSP